MYVKIIFQAMSELYCKWNIVFTSDKTRESEWVIGQTTVKELDTSLELKMKKKIKKKLPLAQQQEHLSRVSVHRTWVLELTIKRQQSIAASYVG